MGKPLLIATSFLGALLLRTHNVEAEAEPFAYIVSYSNDDCSDGGVISLNPVVSGDNELLYGGASDSGLCAREALCRINYQSDQCQALNFTSKAEAAHVVSNNGLIQQCDPTNANLEEPECDFLVECKPSSVFPHCHFHAYLMSDFLADPEMLKNTETTNGTEDQSYMVFYVDDQCQQIEAIQGLLEGETEVAKMDASYSCLQSMYCLMNPTGQACQSLNGPEPGIATIYFANKNSGRDVYECDNSTLSNCTAVSPDTCMQHPLYPSCYYRWTSAMRLLEDPADFIKTTATPTAAPNTKDGASGGVVMKILSALLCAALATGLMLS